MAKVISRFVARAGKTPSGMATGGGETGFDIQPQPFLFTVRLFSSAYRDVLLPKGTLILAYVVFPEGPSLTDDTRVAATDGDVTIDTWNISTGVYIAHKLTATAAEVYSRTAVSGGLLLTADTRFRLSGVSVIPATTGCVRAGFEMIPPAIRL